jgi:hypothetical protein
VKWFAKAAVFVLLAATTAWAQQDVPDVRETDFQFALLKYPGDWNPRPHGLPRLAWEVRRRTSIAVDLATAQVDPTDEALFNYPFVVWQGTRSFGALPDAAVNNLRHHLSSGGTLLIDASDGGDGGAFDQSVRRELRRIFPERPLERVSPDHVVYKSFYLVDRHGGRMPVHPYLEGIFVEGRLAVILSSNDLAGAMARDEYGEWDYDVGVGGDAVREVSFRLGVNLVMYALCLDYKEDQVHIPFILERRR